MEYLTVTEIIEIHNEIIKEYGGTGGIRDDGTLQLLVYKMNREKAFFFARERIPRKCAAMRYSIMRKKPAGYDLRPS